MINREKFGIIENQEIWAYTLKNDHGLEVTCLNYGCIITKIIVPDRNHQYENIVLGFDNIEDYQNHSPYFGAVVGRVAGRIKHAEFELEGKTYQLTKNEADNHLHGGVNGFSDVIWDVSEQDSAILFSYTSVDGEEGYPGNVQMNIRYTLTNDNELSITYSADTDQTTLLNVTNHTYFNLSGDVKSDILNHQLTLKSSEFLELNQELLPTGKKVEVSGTSFDFRNGRKIVEGTESQHLQNHIAGGGYDHPFLLDTHFEQEITLEDDASGRKLMVETDQPCVVLYTGNQLEGDFSIQGVKARKHLGLCLETQGLPDAIHHPDFPSVVLEKDRPFQSTTKYTFLVDRQK